MTKMGVSTGVGRLSDPLFEELQGIACGSGWSVSCTCGPAHSAQEKWRLGRGSDALLLLGTASRTNMVA